MDRILIILKRKENGPRASSVPALGLNTIIFKYVYWYMKQISGERLQDHWSSGSWICFPDVVLSKSNLPVQTFHKSPLFLIVGSKSRSSANVPEDSQCV